MPDFKFVELDSSFDSELAELIRSILKEHKLDVPGTVYFDPELYHLSEYYREGMGRAYYVCLDGGGKLVGGAGFAEVAGEDGICELQKIYLDARLRGQGLGKKLLAHIEAAAKQAGYKQMYLETHDNLASAMALYRRSGFVEIECQLGATGHSTMNHFFLKKL